MTKALDTPHRGEGRWRAVRLGIFVAAGSVASCIAVGGLAAAALRSLEHIPDGHGTATITWTGKSGLHPTISSVDGTVGRYRVEGSGTLPDYSDHHGLTTTPTGITANLATIHGTLDAVPFTIAISLSTGGSGLESHSFAMVTGTFHGVPVSATIDAPTTPRALQTELGTFSGTIGSQHVHGTIYRPENAHGHSTAHAVFVVNG